MSDKESPQSVLDAYHRRQQRSQKAPVVFMIIGAILLIGGAAAVIFWLLGPDQLPFAPKDTDTPTPTVTLTDTPAPTSTNTPTISPTSAPTETPSPTVTTTPSGPFIYVVVEGDTLGSIATQFNTDVATLLALNPSIDPETMLIKVGDQILIPAPDTQLPSATPLPSGLPPGTEIEYRIQAGDTLAQIADTYNSTVEEIMEANPEIENANDIKVGQVIIIPVNIVTPVPTATSGTIFPTIARPSETFTPAP